MQKKAVNERLTDEKFLSNLVKNKFWLIGLILQYVFSASFYLIAQLYIGPALIPGLMATGLIVLAIGSIKIVGEHLRLSEIIGIFLLISAISLLGFSNLSIQITESNLVDRAFLIRLSIFTMTIFIGSIICEIFQRRGNSFQPVYLAFLSGLMFALSNLWVSMLIGIISHFFGDIFRLNEIILFVISCIILILTNFIGTIKIQESFKKGQASNMIPIQQIPIQIAPIFIYFSVFSLSSPSQSSFIFLLIGVIIIIIGSFLLMQHQVKVEQIK